MSKLFESLAVMLGRKPQRPQPEAYTQEAMEIHRLQRQQVQRLTKAKYLALKETIRTKKDRHRWRNRRWATIIIVNLLFVLSFQLDVQVLEGALSASRFMGFHLADVNAALQVMLAYKHVVINLLLGALTVLVIWWLLGGRTFCAWVCPYHLLAEWAESLHLKLVEKRLVKEHTFHRGVRTVFYVLFAVMALVTGYTVFETINPVGIISRALTYGAGFALGWVLLLLLFEVFYSRRAWCRYVCPIGLTYGVLGAFSPIKVTHNIVQCEHEGECQRVCLVPHVLDCVKRGRATSVRTEIGADCTRCGMCVEVCPTQSLRFEVRGLSDLI